MMSLPLPSSFGPMSYSRASAPLRVALPGSRIRDPSPAERRSPPGMAGAADLPTEPDSPTKINKLLSRDQLDVA